MRHLRNPARSPQARANLLRMTPAVPMVVQAVAGAALIVVGFTGPAQPPGDAAAKHAKQKAEAAGEALGEGDVLESVDRALEAADSMRSGTSGEPDGDGGSSGANSPGSIVPRAKEGAQKLLDWYRSRSPYSRLLDAETKGEAGGETGSGNTGSDSPSLSLDIDEPKSKSAVKDAPDGPDAPSVDLKRDATPDTVVLDDDAGRETQSKPDDGAGSEPVVTFEGK